MARRETRDRLARLIKEITIAGGGLAGLSLAVALRGRGVPVTVLEAGHYPRHRVCGEFISGVSAETLEFLGIRDLFDDARLHRSLCWHEDGRVMHRDTLPEPALGISRFVLDERLRQRVDELGGEVKTGIRARPAPVEGLVWAAGRRPRPGPWIGLKAHVRGLPMSADLEMHAGTERLRRTGGRGGWLGECLRLVPARSQPRRERLAICWLPISKRAETGTSPSCCGGPSGGRIRFARSRDSSSAGRMRCPACSAWAMPRA